MQLDLFRRPGPAFRPAPSDAEMWEAVLHVDGYWRLAELLDSRHGDDDAAKLADLRAFAPPDYYVTHNAEERKWAGAIITLEYRYSNQLAP